MASAIAKPTLNVTVAFEVNESEARALDALAGYGDDAFIQALYVHLGRAYMENHGSGLRTFLQSIRDIVRPGLSVIDKARKVLVNEKI